MKKKVLIAVFSLALFAAPMVLTSASAIGQDDKPKQEQKKECTKKDKKECTKKDKKECAKKCPSES